MISNDFLEVFLNDHLDPDQKRARLRRMIEERELLKKYQVLMHENEILLRSLNGWRVFSVLGWGLSVLLFFRG
jgi:hypothetical protein